MPEDNQRRTAVSSTRGCRSEENSVFPGGAVGGGAFRRCSTQRGCKTFLPASKAAPPPDRSISESCSNTSLRTREGRTRVGVHSGNDFSIKNTAVVTEVNGNAKKGTFFFNLWDEWDIVMDIASHS